MVTVTKSVEVKVMHGDQERTARVGIASYERNKGMSPVTVFGYVSDQYPDEMTMMCYEVGPNHFVPLDAVRWARNDGGGWYPFDAGSTTCTRIAISARELEVALYRLGLLDQAGGAS